MSKLTSRFIRDKMVPLGIGFGLALVATEIGLRIAGVAYPNFAISDHHRGYALRPGTRGWQTDEGRAFIEINSRGLRDRERAPTKSPDAYRIAVLGDSFTEAKQVPLDSTFLSVLERDLGHCRALDLLEPEVINFGVSGYGTAQELLTLRHHVWEYDPDLVILAFLSGNDVRDNSKTLSRNALRPYFVYDDDQIVLDDSFRESQTYRARQSLVGRTYYWLYQHSRLIQLVNHTRGRLEQRRFRQRFNPRGEIGLDDMVYHEPPDSVWAEAWRVTEGLIVTMSQEVQARAKFLLVTLSTSIQAHPDSDHVASFMRELGVSDLLYPERRIGALAEEHDIPMLQLAPRFQEFVERNQVYLHGFGERLGTGHWNTEGHRLAGRLIAERVCQMLQ